VGLPTVTRDERLGEPVGNDTSGLRTFTFSQRRPERQGAPKRVLVVGAGLAGLSAAFERTQVGHDVTVLEARARAAEFTRSVIPLPTGSTRKPVPHGFPITRHSRSACTHTASRRRRKASASTSRSNTWTRSTPACGITSRRRDEVLGRGRVGPRSGLLLQAGQFSSLLPHVARPEGRIHFAGEHTSVRIGG
jgi:hypothetical protein